MDFIKHISTPITNNEANPKITTLKLTRGHLSGGFLFFPVGPAGNLHFVAKIGIHQLIPFNSGESYHLSGCIVPFDIDIDFDTPPFEINCITWNDSTEYTHVLTVGFFLTPKNEEDKEINALKAVNALYERQNKL